MIQLNLTNTDLKLRVDYTSAHLSDEKLHYIFITAQKNCVEIMVNSHFAKERIIRLPYTDDYPFSRMAKDIAYDLHGLYNL